MPVIVATVCETEVVDVDLGVWKVHGWSTLGYFMYLLLPIIDLSPAWK
jgi:hypothetical protein